MADIKVQNRVIIQHLERLNAAQAVRQAAHFEELPDEIRNLLPLNSLENLERLNNWILQNMRLFSK